MGNFAEVLAESNLKLLILSVYNLMRTKYKYNQVCSYMVYIKKTTQHLRLILIGVWGVAAISINPNTRSTGAATITTLPETPQRPMPVGEEDIIGA